MGHRDSSEKQRGAGGVCGVGGGFSAVDEERVNPPMNMSIRNEAREKDRRKSVPPWAAVATGIGEGGASPAPTATGKQSVGVKAALAALRIYKVYLSVLFAGSCRFEPTCSMYMYEAIERFGVMRGSWMGLKRLLRCQPLSRKFGYDPVPEKTEATALQAGGVGQDTGRSGVASREAHS
jgi:putative membrane protein insertion efficiency factor